MDCWNLLPIDGVTFGARRKSYRVCLSTTFVSVKRLLAKVIALLEYNKLLVGPVRFILGDLYVPTVNYVKLVAWLAFAENVGIASKEFLRDIIIT